MARIAGREIELIPGTPAVGGTSRRCPDISKLAQLGYKPRVPLDEGLKRTLDWYWHGEHLAPMAGRHRGGRPIC
jgi:nucleoside-diphosphate-sugar epimerase